MATSSGPPPLATCLTICRIHDPRAGAANSHFGRTSAIGPFFTSPTFGGTGLSQRLPRTVAAVELGGVRTLLAVPMLKDEIPRRRVRDLPPGSSPLHRQADRTGAEFRRPGRHRHREYAAAQRAAPAHRPISPKSLEQQTATSEVLQVISSSPGDLEPVFATMLENAVRICGAKFGNIYRWDGEALHLVATHNTPPAFAEARRRSPFVPVRKPLSAACWRPKRWFRSPICAEQGYLSRRSGVVAPSNLEACGRLCLFRC